MIQRLDDEAREAKKDGYELGLEWGRDGAENYLSSDELVRLHNEGCTYDELVEIFERHEIGDVVNFDDYDPIHESGNAEQFKIGFTEGYLESIVKAFESLETAERETANLANTTNGDSNQKVDENPDHSVADSAIQSK